MGPGADRVDGKAHPRGTIEVAIPVERIIGCVAFASGEKIEPDVIRHVEGRRFPVGEPDGSASERCRRLVRALTDEGFKSYLLEDISALSQTTMVDICRFPDTRELASRMMREAWETAEKLDIRFRNTIEERLAGAEKVGPHRTSMLQDVAAGRDPETEALIGAVLELARMMGTPAPSTEAVWPACGFWPERIWKNGPGSI